MLICSILFYNFSSSIKWKLYNYLSFSYSLLYFHYPAWMYILFFLNFFAHILEMINWSMDSAHTFRFFSDEEKNLACVLKVQHKLKDRKNKFFHFIIVFWICMAAEFLRNRNRRHKFPRVLSGCYLMNAKKLLLIKSTWRSAKKTVTTVGLQ